MHRPVDNLYTVRHSIIKEQLAHMPEETMIREINHAASRMLASKIVEDGKFNLTNITEEELDLYRKGLSDRKHLIDDYFSQGLEHYEGRVYIFTPDELRKYVNSVVDQAIHDRLDKLLHAMNHKKG